MHKSTCLIGICIYCVLIVDLRVMVSLSDTRELLLISTLIGGFAGAFLFFDTPAPISLGELRFIATPTPSHAPRVLGASTHIPLVANPVVHIDVPAHNIFEPN